MFSELIKDCENWVFGGDVGAIQNNSILLDRFTSLLNFGVDRTSVKILENDGRWQYDDNNHADYPEATTDLNSGTQTYKLEKTFMKIEGFEVMDLNGDFYKVNPIDKEEIRRMGYSVSTFFDVAGTPEYYDLEGDIVTLYPAPASTSVTCGASTNGLKVMYQRPSSYFVSTDTTKEVGVATPFIDMPVLYACQKFCKQNSMPDKARELDAEITKRENELEIFFSKRVKDDRTIIRVINRSSR